MARRLVGQTLGRWAGAVILTCAAVNQSPALAQEQQHDAQPSIESPANPTAAADQPVESPATDSANPASPTEEVVVSGEQPGPGLWKVSRGTHVMWVLGTLSPSPKNMTWRSTQVESVIASSQQILGEEEVSSNIGLFRGLRWLPSVLRARFNPDGAVLKDLLEPALYERWLPLRAKYFRDDDDIEKVRPMFIAFQLYAKAIERADLTRRSATSKVLRKAAKKHDVKITNTEIEVDIDDPRRLIRDFAETPRNVDLGCLVDTIDRLESDVEAMKQRANAWAVGDVEALKRLPVPVQEAACRDAVTSAPGLQDEFNALKDRVLATWLADAEAALARNEVTFAVLSMSDILDERGRLAQLRARGYTVEPPQS